MAAPEIVEERPAGGGGRRKKGKQRSDYDYEEEE
jgi:hypothetical protein